MVFVSFPTKRAFLALSASLSLLTPVLADEAGTPAEQPKAETSTGTGSTAESAVEKPASGETTTERVEPKVEAKPESAAEAKADPHKSAELEKGIIEANARTHAVEKRPAAPPSHPTAQPMRLYGRIEELCAGTGAKIPLKMVAMQPVRDTSYDTKLSANATKLNAGASQLVQSFPIDYRGTWSGELTLNSVNFDPSYFSWSPEVANKEARMMRPGMKGSCSITFYQGANNKIAAEPSQVLFQAMDTLAGSGGLGQLGAMANNPMFANMQNMQVPVTLALKLGAPVQAFEHGVTGDQMSKEVMKNTLKELGRGYLEQDVVTKDTDRSADGRAKVGYSESVLRFTRLNDQQLYVQAAYVYYNTQAKFQAKYILYGTLNRTYGQAPATTTNPYGTRTMPNPFGGMMPGAGGMGGMGGGAGGAQSLQDAAGALQKMLQQMGGR